MIPNVCFSLLFVLRGVCFVCVCARMLCGKSGFQSAKVLFKKLGLAMNAMSGGRAGGNVKNGEDHEAGRGGGLNDGIRYHCHYYYF